MDSSRLSREGDCAPGIQLRTDGHCALRTYCVPEQRLRTAERCALHTRYASSTAHTGLRTWNLKGAGGL